MPSVHENTMAVAVTTTSKMISEFDATMLELEADIDAKRDCPVLPRSKSCNALYVESSNYYNYEHVSERSYEHHYQGAEDESDCESDDEEPEAEAAAAAARNSAAPMMGAIAEETASDLKSGLTQPAVIQTIRTPEPKGSPQFAELLHTLPVKKPEENRSVNSASQIAQILSSSSQFKAPSPPPQMNGGSSSTVMSPIRNGMNGLTRQLSNLSLGAIHNTQSNQSLTGGNQGNVSHSNSIDMSNLATSLVMNS